LVQVSAAMVAACVATKASSAAKSAAHTKTKFLLQPMVVGF